jgi:hypothetical protein
MNLPGSVNRHVPTLLLLTAFAPGCAVLNQDAAVSSKLPETLAKSEQTPSQHTNGSITLEVRPSGDRPEIRQIPISGPLHVQDTLEQAGLVKRFKRMELHVLRVVGDQRQKMQSRYRHEDGMVEPLYDYALHPGDHVVVEEDTRNIIDDMLGAVSGPLGWAF